MKKNIKKIIFSSVLVLPLLLNPLASASSSVELSKEKTNVNSSVKVAEKENNDDRVPVYKTFKYPLGNSYPASVYAETYYKNIKLKGYIPATNAYVDNDYLVVTYYGILTN